MTTVDILIRIGMAIVVGGMVGYERELRNRPAGFITHTLVCVGACVVSLIQVNMIADTVRLIRETPALISVMNADLGRVVAQVVTGVGFLGAGTIINDKGSVKGLTTATTIWVVACIGLAIGLGYYKISIIAAIGVVFIITGLKALESKTLDRKYTFKLELKYMGADYSQIQKLSQFFKEKKVMVRGIEIVETEDSYTVARFELYTGFSKSVEHIIEQLVSIEDIISVSRLN